MFAHVLIWKLNTILQQRDVIGPVHAPTTAVSYETYEAVKYAQLDDRAGFVREGSGCTGERCQSELWCQYLSRASRRCS